MLTKISIVLFVAVVGYTSGTVHKLTSNWKIFKLYVNLSSKTNSHRFITTASGAPLSDERIVGGSRINITQTPWQVAVMLYNVYHICGGSIIGKRWVLTAAHCVFGLDDIRSYKALVGADDTTNLNGTKYSIASYVIHDGWNPETIDYDFALLELDGEFEFNDRVQPIQMPKVDDEHIAIGTTVLVSGYGETMNATEPVRYLRAVEIPAVDQQECKDIYEDIKGVTERMFCAGFEDGGKSGWWRR